MSICTDRISFDEKTTLEVATGLISDAGRIEITEYLASLDLPELPVNWDWHARVGGKGEYVGTFPKRVAKYYYQKHQRKLTSDQLGHIGSVMAKHTNRHNRYTFDFTDSFDWSAGDYGDSGSCYWGCRRGARKLLDESGALAIRFYDENDDGMARAWICRGNGLYYLFNGYGLETADIARIFAQYLGASYRQIDLANNGSDSGIIWINGGTGYAIGPEESVNGMSSYDLEIAEGEKCADCGEYHDPEDMTYIDDHGYVCEDCLSDYSYCEDCDCYYHNDDIHRVYGARGWERYVCDSCLDNYSQCEHCEEYFHSDNVREIDGNCVCDKCVENGDYTICDDCGDWHHHNYVREVDGEWVCDDCLDSGEYSECSDCRDWHHNDKMTEVDGDSVCDRCLANGDYAECAECGDWHCCDDMTEDDGRLLCADCVENTVEVC
jgi:formylmethanofuran dehydrogenase subunit E